MHGRSPERARQWRVHKAFERRRREALHFRFVAYSLHLLKGCLMAWSCRERDSQGSNKKTVCGQFMGVTRRQFVDSLWPYRERDLGVTRRQFVVCQLCTLFLMGDIIFYAIEHDEINCGWRTLSQCVPGSSGMGEVAKHTVFKEQPVSVAKCMNKLSQILGHQVPLNRNVRQQEG